MSGQRGMGDLALYISGEHRLSLGRGCHENRLPSPWVNRLVDGQICMVNIWFIYELIYWLMVNIWLIYELTYWLMVKIWLIYELIYWLMVHIWFIYGSYTVKGLILAHLLDYFVDNISELDWIDFSSFSNIEMGWFLTRWPTDPWGSKPFRLPGAGRMLLPRCSAIQSPKTLFDKNIIWDCPILSKEMKLLP